MRIYTDLTEKEIAKFCELYNLGPVKEFHLLTDGASNTNYLLITEKGKFVLTICDDKTFEQVRPLMVMFPHLEVHNFHTSKLLKSQSGEFLLEMDNTPVYLKAYIEGLVPRKLSLTSLEHCGKMIAKLHKIPIFNSIPDGYQFGLKFFSDLITSASAHPYIDWLKEKCQYIEERLPNDLPRGLVHGDIYPDNLVIGSQGQIIIIDFEAVSHAPFILDIGMALTGVCSEKNSISLRKAKALIKGYLQERELTPMEKNGIKLFTIYTAISLTVWRFMQFLKNIPIPRYQQMVGIVDSLVQMKNSSFMKQVGLR